MTMRTDYSSRKRIISSRKRIIGCALRGLLRGSTPARYGTIPDTCKRSGERRGVEMMLTKVLTIGAVFLLSAAGAMAQTRSGAMAAAKTCKPDIAQFCSQVPPGGGRIKACMKEHLPELSEPCKEALFQAWLRQ
jgi:hypothetical protein